MATNYQSKRLTTRQLNFLGLKEHPFRASADPRFLYLSRNHLTLLDRLQDIIDAGRDPDDSEAGALVRGLPAHPTSILTCQMRSTLRSCWSRPRRP